MTPLPRRHLPGLNRDVSAVGAGCWPLGGPAHNNGVPIGWGRVDDGQAQQTLSSAYEAGITIYDTADVYGRSERHLGEFLSAVPHGVVTVISKVGYTSRDGRHPYHPQVMRRQLTTTLTNLALMTLQASANRKFGFAVSLTPDGNSVVLGMPYGTEAGAAGGGAATQFTRSGSTWSNTQSFSSISSRVNNGDYFGSTVALDAGAGHPFIGALGVASNGNTYVGAAYTY